jgi:hypothetical protein
MAYYSQERKAQIAPKIKALLKKYGLKGSLSVDNHSTVVLSIKSGKIDFIRNLNSDVSAPRGGYINVNPYHYQYHFNGDALSALTELFGVLNEGNHDNSDIQSDYFDVGWYVDVNIGKWDKPYILEN